MRNFRSDNQGEFRGREGFRDRYGGGRSGGREEFRGRDSRGSERRPFEMHETTCSKCGKRCEVPFRPTTGKPVFCSDCFKKNDSFEGSNFSSRNQERQSQPGISPEQFSQLNAKLDKILQVLESLELDVEDEDEEEKEDDSK
ncbi:MAG: CxxC-x17-CxxC domain-containing protein [archaeon]